MSVSLVTKGMIAYHEDATIVKQNVGGGGGGVQLLIENPLLSDQQQQHDKEFFANIKADLIGINAVPDKSHVKAELISIS